MNISNRIGDFIRNYRKQMNLTQEELATMAKISERYLGEIERGEKKLTLELLEKITNAFDMTLTDFFFLMQPLKNDASKNMQKIVNILKEQDIDDQATLYEFLKLLINWKK